VRKLVKRQSVSEKVAGGRGIGDGQAEKTGIGKNAEKEKISIRKKEENLIMEL